MNKTASKGLPRPRAGEIASTVAITSLFIMMIGVFVGGQGINRVKNLLSHGQVSCNYHSIMRIRDTNGHYLNTILGFARHTIIYQNGKEVAPLYQPKDKPVPNNGQGIGDLVDEYTASPLPTYYLNAKASIKLTVPYPYQITDIFCGANHQSCDHVTLDSRTNTIQNVPLDCGLDVDYGFIVQNNEVQPIHVTQPPLIGITFPPTQTPTPTIVRATPTYDPGIVHQLPTPLVITVAPTDRLVPPGRPRQLEPTSTPTPPLTPTVTPTPIKKDLQRFQTDVGQCEAGFEQVSDPYIEKITIGRVGQKPLFTVDTTSVKKNGDLKIPFYIAFKNHRIQVNFDPRRQNDVAVTVYNPSLHYGMYDRPGLVAGSGAYPQEVTLYYFFKKGLSGNIIDQHFKVSVITKGGCEVLPTATPKPSPTPTLTPTPTITNTPAPSNTPTPTPTNTPTPTATPTPTPTPADGSLACNSTASRVNGPPKDVQEWEMGKTEGDIFLHYNMVEAADADMLVLFYEGVKIYSTGGPVSGTRYNEPLHFGPGTSTKIRAEITSPLGRRFWMYSLSCPKDPSTTPGPSCTAEKGSISGKINLDTSSIPECSGGGCSIDVIVGCLAPGCGSIPGSTYLRKPAFSPDFEYSFTDVPTNEDLFVEAHLYLKTTRPPSRVIRTASYVTIDNCYAPREPNLEIGYCAIKLENEPSCSANNVDFSMILDPAPTPRTGASDVNRETRPQLSQKMACKSLDINADSSINSLDYASISVNYLAQGTNLKQDLNCDDSVNALDLSLLLGRLE